jgi:hypothetical protein
LPYHGDCLEGLASGSAIRARWGRPTEEVTDEQAWALEGECLALGLVKPDLHPVVAQDHRRRRRYETAVPAAARYLTRVRKKADEPILAPKGRGPTDLQPFPLQRSHFCGAMKGTVRRSMDPLSERPARKL